MASTQGLLPDDGAGTAWAESRRGNLTQSQGHGIQLAHGSVLNARDIYFGDSLVNRVSVKENLIEDLQFDTMNEREYIIDDECYQTCQWMLYTDEWRDWQRSMYATRYNRLLWIKGKPGSGKSTLMKFAYQRGYHPGDNEIVLAHFFNARGTELDKSAEGMYRTLLVQLLEGLPPGSDVFKLMPRRPARGKSWTLPVLTDIFKKILRKRQDQLVTCFIDALDECREEQAEAMVKSFYRLVEEGDRVRICFASRHFPNLAMPKEVYIDLVLELQKAHKEDLLRYIKEELLIGKGTEEMQAVRRRIQEKSGGVFLWCKMVILDLNRRHARGRLTKAEAEAVLDQTPTELSQLFADILGIPEIPNNEEVYTKLNDRDLHRARETLLCMQWVLFQGEAVSPLEIWWAVQWGMKLLEGSDTTPQPPLDEGGCDRFAVEISRGLVEVIRVGDIRVGDATKRVQVIHESVRDFLIKEQALERLALHSDDGYVKGVDLEAQCHDRLKSIFLMEVSQCALRAAQHPEEHSTLTAVSPVLKSVSEYASWVDKHLKVHPALTAAFPLLKYAAYAVLDHASKAQAKGNIDQSQFLTDLEQLRSRCSSTAQAIIPSLLRENRSLMLVLLDHAEVSLIPICYRVVEEKLPGRRGKLLWDILWPAASSPPSPVLSWKHFESTLNWDKMFLIHRRKALKALVEVHAHSQAQGSVQHRVLTDLAGRINWSGLSDKYPSVVRSHLLLELAGASDELGTFLLVTLVAAAAADPSGSQLQCGQIYEAALNGFACCLASLPGSGVTLGDLSLEAREVFLWAASNGHTELVQILVTHHRVSVNTQAQGGITALHAAASSGHAAVVKYLLSAGSIKHNFRDHAQQSPLDMAKLHGHKDIVDLLTSAQSTSTSVDA